MFGRRTDPEGEFVRKYLPVLKNMPTKYIFDPWTAPIEVQKEAKCVIGEDYPFPIVNHGEASHANIEKMKKVFKNISKYCGPGLLAAVPSSKAASTRLNMAKSFVVPQSNTANQGTSNMIASASSSYYKQQRPMINSYNSEYSSAKSSPMTTLSQDQLNQMNLPSGMQNKNMYGYN